ncbi:MAG: GIY-YIG nuclease family protein [Flavobacteriaceae bacterium]|nr:GIY-YIG nuclease family protein [Bacteroidia bacterium]NND10506.1 GIY-YIG nuclease family protein [Flavobacteriaceae bacterium]NNK27565.1 GIY-YIG nuclease family protein [Flavobacteriaceae bacterium]NNL61937.1 GIY-YIG nuclease family protein [Flavobacteriaceae bacterium]
MKHWHVYIMANKPNGIIYIGVTDNIDERVKEHKLKLYPRAFTARYNCDKLVYFEEFENGDEAVTRERQFKKWKRDWKIILIEEMNPSWSDLSMNWNLDYRRVRTNN